MGARDATIRDALERVQQTYVEPDRIDPPRMLAAALRTLARTIPGGGVKEGEEAVELLLGGETVRIARPSPGGSLPDALGPALEQAMAALQQRRLAGGADLPEPRRARAAMLHGALRTLDSFSGAYTGGSRTNLIGKYTGTAVGVGIRIGRREGAIRVLEVFAGSGAEAAGLRAGDTLCGVDGASLDGLQVSQVSGLLRGAAASRVAIEVERDGETLTLTVTRKEYVRPTVEGRLEADHVGVVRIRHLSKNTPAQVIDELEGLAGKHRMRKLILDLRGNTGGSMLAAAQIADLFVDRGVLLEALDRFDRPVEGLRERVEASRRGWVRMPVVVLVDGSTGSSSELLAAALAWHDRALLLGERTYGKNVVQKLHNFEADDLSLKISAAYMKAAGRRLPAEGLAPDVRVRAEEDAGAPPPPGSLVLPAGEEDDPWVALARRLLSEHGGPSRAAMVQSIRAAS